MSMLRELRRRNVLRVGAAYLAGSWLLIQLMSNLLPFFGVAADAGRPVVVLLAIGFVPALVLAWVFELTPKGFRRDTGASTGDVATRVTRRFDRSVIVVLLLAVALFAIDRFVLDPVRDAELVAATAERIATDLRTQAVGDKSVAVLPFSDLSETGDQAWLADGLAEEIIHSLWQLSEFKVIARTSSFQFRDENRDIPQIAATLGVANIVEGSIRRSGDRIVTTAQLIRARDGFRLWSQTYDQMGVDVLDVQRDVAEQIASALDVLLDDERRAAMLRSGTRNVEAFEQAQRGWAIYRAVHANEPGQTLWEANALFEQALAIDPGYAAAALGVADAYTHLLLSGPFRWVADAPYSDEEALSRLHDILDVAIRESPNEAMRTFAELTRELYSPNWYRLLVLIEQLRDSEDLGSLHPELMGDLSRVLEFTGNSELMREIAEQFLIVDPLNPASWGNLIEVEIHAGNLATATDLIREARRAVGDNPGFAEFEFQTLALARGGPGSPERDATIAWLEANVNPRHPLIAALRGEREYPLQVAALIEKGGVHDLLPIELYCLAGDYDAARSFVQRVDAATAGPATLLIYAAARRNYVFQDFAATPNFVRQLRQAGLDPAAYPGDCPPSAGAE